MPLTDDQALAQLQALVAVPAALKIITAEHACGAGKHPGAFGFSPTVCASFRFPLTSPKHFVLHDVVRVDGPDDRGRVTARSAEGDWTTGYPAAVLSRLTEWQG